MDCCPVRLGQWGHFGVWDGPVVFSDVTPCRWVSTPEVSEDREVPSVSDKAARKECRE